MKVVSLSAIRAGPQKILLVLISVRVLFDSRVTVTISEIEPATFQLNQPLHRMSRLVDLL